MGRLVVYSIDTESMQMHQCEAGSSSREMASGPGGGAENWYQQNLKASSKTVGCNSHFFIIYGTVIDLDIYNDPRFLLSRSPAQPPRLSSLYSADR